LPAEQSPSKSGGAEGLSKIFFQPAGADIGGGGQFLCTDTMRTEQDQQEWKEKPAHFGPVQGSRRA